MTQLSINRLQQAEYQRTVYRVVPELSTPYESLFDPQYWAHVSAKLRPGDRLEIEAEDGSYYAELRVMDAGTLYARVAELKKVDFDDGSVSGDQPVLSGYEVKWRGPILKWSVLRGKDAIHDGEQSKGAANSWLAEHIKVVR
jgi:hypothetical protein